VFPTQWIGVWWGVNGFGGGGYSTRLACCRMFWRVTGTITIPADAQQFSREVLDLVMNAMQHVTTTGANLGYGRAYYTITGAAPGVGPQLHTYTGLVAGGILPVGYFAACEVQAAVIGWNRSWSLFQRLQYVPRTFVDSRHHLTLAAVTAYEAFGASLMAGHTNYGLTALPARNSGGDLLPWTGYVPRRKLGYLHRRQKHVTKSNAGFPANVGPL
jgi:hypothetical protein